MKWEVKHSPAYSLLKVFLTPGESLTVEAGSYMAHRGDVEIKTGTKGLLSAISRAIFTGEPVFLNTLTARNAAEIWVAPPAPGDIAAIQVEPGKPIVIQDTSFLAYSGDIKLSVSFSFKRFWVERQFAWLKAEGLGTVWVSSYGAMETVELGPGERMTVDNLHFVAMEDTLHYRTRKFGGWKSTIFGGEGLVIELEGPGKVWLQTRMVPGLVELLSPYIKTR